MKLKIMFATSLLVCGYAFAASEPQKAPSLTGAWNIISTYNTDSTCTKSTPGDAQAYVWIISQSGNGSVSVSVQGETTFPKLTGLFDKESKTLIVSGKGASWGTTFSWFKLTLNDKNELTGIRRYLSAAGSIDNSLCFGDSDVVAKRQ